MGVTAPASYLKKQNYDSRNKNNNRDDKGRVNKKRIFKKVI